MPSKKDENCVERRSRSQNSGWAYDRREEVFLHNPIFGEECIEELKQMDKHEIIVKICDVLGSCPSNLPRAEEIFEQLKFDIAEYVLHHEYSQENGIRSKLLLWLDSKKNPKNRDKLFNFVNKYLK
ncbi:MAG: hypothetical protein GY754_20240 [bacterium]|nr:hypothetical protein [bacterium]